jgi:hypothetical protein
MLHAEAEASGCGSIMKNTEGTGNPVKDLIGDMVCVDAGRMKRLQHPNKLRKKPAQAGFFVIFAQKISDYEFVVLR